MFILARLLGVVAIVIGVVVALNPIMINKMLEFWKRGKNVYLAGAARLIFGVMFLVIAPGCRYTLIVTILGALMLIGGVIVFVLGPVKIRPIFEWFGKMKPVAARLMGLVALLIGCLIVYSI